MADANAPRAFIAGYPIDHSRSPILHRHWLKTLAIPGFYDKLEIAPGDFAEFVRSLKNGSSGFVGGNITIPHKQVVFELADEVDETARQIGAANTIWVDDGRLCVTNTDTHGFAANLDEQAPGWTEGNNTAVVLGAGGASRAVIHALLARGFAFVRVVNRTKARAQELADRFGPRVSAHGMEELADLLVGAGLFVNTSSLGLDGAPAPQTDFTAMAPGALVTDIVYVPLVTPFLAMARDQGLATADGLGMLLHQAVPGFQIWFGRSPEVTPELRDLVIKDMERKQ